MKNNRGFTLIEIIVSLALLSIISVGMISGLTSQFRFLTGSRDFTEDLAAAQQEMESKIAAVKKTLQDEDIPSDWERYTLFSGANARTVYGYPREYKVSGVAARTLFTVVGSEVLDYPVPAITAEINFDPAGPTSKLFENSLTDSLCAVSDVNITENAGIHLTDTYVWYVSREGFNIPMISGTPTEVEVGTKYPRFPDDYKIIKPRVTTQLLASLVSNPDDLYLGRHVLCAVTPASTSGKMGATVVSNPLFISGLPYRTGLSLHLDASLISREAGTLVRSVSPSGPYYVRNWYDCSGMNKDAAQSNESKQPELIETFIGDIIDEDGYWHESYAKYAAFDGVNDVMTTSVGGYADTMGTNSTVFVVARDAGAAKFTIYKDDVPDKYLRFPSSGWSSSSVTIGYTGSPGVSVDVAEVIIYCGTVLSPDASDAVMTYLENKYLPVTPEVTIQWLTNVTDTVLTSASAYTPPATVSAYMSNGRFRDVPVTWSPASLDISTLGDKVSTSTAVSDTTKHGTLTVHVVPPTPLVGIGPITAAGNGTLATLTAGALDPSGAAGYVTYQWWIADSAEPSGWREILFENSAVYDGAMWGKTYKVVATATTTGIYTGSAEAQIYLEIKPLYGIGDPVVIGGGDNAELKAGVLDPPDATVHYQWQCYNATTRDWDNVGSDTKIYSYAIWDKTYHVVVSGYGGYSGSATSREITPTRALVTGIGDIAIYWDGSNFRLTAGAVSPVGATVDYQWLYYYPYYYGGGEWRPVSGAISSTLTAITGTHYKVQATGNGMYYGTAISNEIIAEPIDLKTIGATIVTWDGANPVLTAGAIDPAGATVTYQWQYYSSYWNRWYDVDGATSSTYTGTSGARYRVKVTGTGMYEGTIYGGDLTVPTRNPLTAVHITYSWVGSDPILRVDSTTPSGATATYQWWANPGTGWSSIDGATSSSYTGIPGTQYKVVGTGNDMYYGTVESNVVAVPNRTPVTRVEITYTWSGANAALSVSSLTPTAATATYQWWSNSGSGWNSIPGATSATYTGASGVQYKVVATGTGAYTGMVESDPLAVPLRQALGGVSITVTWNGSTPTLTAVPDPSGATATYQWEYYKNNSWRDAGTSLSITGIEGRLYRVTATGYGAYYGTKQSDEITPRRSALVSIGNITASWNGSSFTLTAGAVNPEGATVTYKWYANGSVISGATASTYSNAVAGSSYYVEVTGFGGYTGTKTSATIKPGDPVSVGNITITMSGTTPILTAGAVSPSGATFTYQWQSYSGGWNDISGATSSSYAGTISTRYRVSVTGTGAYYGTDYSDEITPPKLPLDSIGTPSVSWNGSRFTLTAGAVNPSGATFTYQWQSGSGSNITGATSSTYNTTSAGLYRVTAIGTGIYTGTVYSDWASAGTAVESVTIRQSGSLLVVDTISPSGATVTYQWQRSQYNWLTGWSAWSNFSTGSTCSYTPDGWRDYRYQLIVTGTGQYYGSATSQAIDTD